MEYQKRLIRRSNALYNDGLKKARVRDLSGAIASLKKSLKYCGANTDARNLLGLVYFGRGEVAEALVQWIISKNYKAHENIAEYYIRKVQDTPGQLDIINSAVKRYNQSLVLCRQGNEDMAIIQLKKAVSAHPSFVKALQLLGLLYLQTGDAAKARAALRRAQRLDTSDPLTQRYLHALKAYYNKPSEQEEDREKAVIYQTGNESGGRTASVSIMNLFIGILVGAAVVWFLVVPAVNAMKASNVTRTAAAYSQEIAVQKAQVSALKRELDEYRAASEASEAEKATAASAQESYENLLTVIDQNRSGDYSNADMAEILKKINASALGEGGREIYTGLTESIYPRVCAKLYDSARSEFRDGNNAGAITALEEILVMDEKYEDGDALLALADAYLAAGETDKSKAKYNRVIELYPDSSQAEKARGGLAGTAADIFKVSDSRSSSSDSNSEE